MPTFLRARWKALESERLLYLAGIGIEIFCGCSLVFLAHDPQLGRDVALKTPRAEAILDPATRSRFLVEANAAVGLNHANIVPAFEAGLARSPLQRLQALQAGTHLGMLSGLSTINMLGTDSATLFQTANPVQPLEPLFQSLARFRFAVSIGYLKVELVHYFHESTPGGQSCPDIPARRPWMSFSIVRRLYREPFQTGQPIFNPIDLQPGIRQIKRLVDRASRSYIVGLAV